MSEELARLETLGGMEFGRCGAVAVELAQGIEGVHVAEIEQADLAIVQGVAGAKVPLEQAAEQQGQQRLEELDELALVPCPYRLAVDPGRKQYAVAKAGVVGIDDGAQARGEPRIALERAQFRTPLDLVEKARLPIEVLHLAALAGAFERPVAATGVYAVDMGRQPAAEVFAHVGLGACGRNQLFERQQAVGPFADFQFRAAGDEGQLVPMALLFRCHVAFLAVAMVQRP